MSVASDSVAHDEGPHLPSDEALWNESWYFDFVDAAAGLGGWVRLGLYPNEDRAWVNVLLCGPGLPTLALNDFHAALPDDPARVFARAEEDAKKSGDRMGKALKRARGPEAAGFGYSYDMLGEAARTEADDEILEVQ